MSSRRHLRSRVRRAGAVFLGSFCIAAACGCAAPAIQNVSGAVPMSHAPGDAGRVQGIGIESHDIVSMSDQMMRDMLSNPRLLRPQAKDASPRVIVDAAYFANDSTQPINRNLITDRLRVSLNRASQGRLTFVGRQYASMVQDERDLKRTGTVDVGTSGRVRAQMGADLRLGGRIATLDQQSPRSGMMQRYTQITFEMIDQESGEIIWSGIYEFARSAADDVMYR